jgi:N-dimethylarginine dimethylaminohydrolase
MTTHRALGYGPRLAATSTGRLLGVVLVRPTRAIENARPLPGEPGAVYARALEQHDVLRKKLEYFGVEVTVFESHAMDSYEAAAGDAAVAFEDGAVMMRLTALSRRGEVDRMQSEFARIDVPIAGHIAAPGLLDGNDVVMAGDTAFVGVGARGNEVGRRGFAELARSHGFSVREVKLAPGVPALRAVVSAVGPDTIVLGGDKADASAFAGFKTIVLERGEEHGAGVLCLDERHVVADIRYRTSLSILRRAGIGVEAIDLYDFTKVGITPAMLALVLRRD